jgi:hypothetical protein
MQQKKKLYSHDWQREYMHKNVEPFIAKQTITNDIIPKQLVQWLECPSYMGIEHKP